MGTAETGEKTKKKKKKKNQSNYHSLPPSSSKASTSAPYTNKLPTLQACDNTLPPPPPLPPQTQFSPFFFSPPAALDIRFEVLWNLYFCGFGVLLFDGFLSMDEDGMGMGWGGMGWDEWG